MKDIAEREQDDRRGSAPSATVSLLVADAVFAGGSTMAARCRAFDWASTPMGPVDCWPSSLRTAAAIVLASGFPSIVLWGPDLIQLYNDAYAPFLGVKDATALGRPTRVVWPEVWDFNAPIYARVQTGETVTLAD